MAKIESPRIVNERQDSITQKLISDYKNYEKFDGYNKETAALGKAHLKKMGEKLNKSRRTLIEDASLKENHPDKYKKFAMTYKKYESEINVYTKKLGNHEYMRHHEETLNKLGSIIDNYENEVIELIKDLVEDMGDSITINEERGRVETANATVKYVEIGNDGIYKLTKATNRPKIHQVLGGILSPGEIRKIDYSGCTNTSIKTRMINAISNSQYENAQQSSSCFLQYDNIKKTYVLSDGDGNILQQRALIWEGVKLTPPSKTNIEARAIRREGQQQQIDKINNINLSDREQAELLESMPEKMRNRLKKEDINEFFRVTEQSLNERIIEAKQEGYDLASDPISKYEGNGYLMKLNLINANAEISKPLIKNNFSRNVRDAFSKGQLKKYLSSRIQKKRQEFDYLTKRGNVINVNEERNEQDMLKNNEKEFAVKGLQMLGSRADAVADKIGDTWIKDDDREFSAIKNYVKDAENDINTQNVTHKDIIMIKNKLTQMLTKFFANNWIRSSMQINGYEIKGYIDDIITSGSKEKQIVAMRKIGVSRTWFDNSETAFLREEIFDTFNRVEKRDENGNIILDEEGNPVYEERDIDLKDDNYEKYFTRIKELYQIDPEVLESSGEIPSDKKQAIDELYNAARTCTGKHGVKNFKRRLLNKGLIPDWTGHGGQIDDKVRALKMQLEQQEKNANKFEVTGQEIRERTRQKLADLQLTLTTEQIQAANEGDDGRNDEGIARLNALNFMLAQDDSFFQEIAKNETTDTKKSLKYGGVESTVKGNLAPYLIRRGGGINSDSELARIYNDSVGAGGWFDYSDEGSEKVGPIIKDIIVEVVVTAVSIVLCWNGAGEAIYAAFRAAKIAVQAMKGFRKFIQFMKIFAKQLLKNMLTQGLGKLRIGTARIGKHTIGGAKAAAQIVRHTETLSRRGRLAIKGTSLVVEGTTFHINSTIIHNILNGEDFWEGLDPLGYTEGPDGERIPNWQSYAQSIAFLGVLKGTGKVIGKITGKSLEGLTGKEIQNIAKGRYGPATVNKIFSTSLSLSSEMGSMMLTDQILSLTFDQSLKPITGEELITMFGMIVGLRLNGKFQMRIKEHSGRKTTIRMEQGGTGNKFDVSIDHEGNILKVEGVDKNGNRIPNPEQICGLKAGENGMNMRDIPNAIGNNTGTIEGGRQAGRNLENLNTGDEISVNHGEHTIRLKKTANGKRKVSDPGGSAFERGTEFDVERNPNDNSYHLKNSEGRGTISLDGQINVRLQSRFGTEIRSGNTERPGNEGILIEGGNQRIEELNRLRENKQTIEAQRNETKTRLEEIQREQEEIRNKINNNNNSKKEQIKIENKLKQKKEELNNKKNELEAQRLRLQEQLLNTTEYNNLGIVSLTDFPLKKGNKVSIGGKKCKYIGIVEGKLTFKPDDGGELKRYSSFKDLNDAKIKFDIESRQELGRSQQEIFNKLVEREIAQGRKAELQLRRNNLIEEINNLVKNNENFELNKAKLSGKNIRINGVEYKISLTKKGLLRFVEVKGQGDFTINSFKQLLDMGQIKGFSDGYARSGSMIRGSETLTRSEIENNRLIENILNIERQNNSRIAQKKLELNQIESELSQVPQGEKISNPEYQRIQKEIERIDGLIKNKEGEIRVKDEELLNNQSDQIKLETELRGLKEQEGEILGRKETAQQELNKAEDNLRRADEEYNDITNQIRNNESELNNPTQQNEEINNNIGEQEISNLETEYNILKVESQQLKFHEKQIELLRKSNIELEAELRAMKRNIGGEVEIEGRKVTVTEELIEVTEKQLEKNYRDLNEHMAKLGQAKGGVVNLEQNGSISIMKTDFSMERILPDGTICKGDFGQNGNLVSGVKIHTDGSIEYGTYNERGELFLGMKETKLQDGGYKQTYNTLNGIYEIKLDANHNIVGDMEKIADSYHSPVQPEEAKSILNRFKDFKEDLKKRLENRRIEREQRAKEREEARAKKLTHNEKKLLNDIIEQAQTLQKNSEKKYYIGNGESIRIKKLVNGKFIEMEEVIEIKNNRKRFLLKEKGNEMTENELKALLKEKIIDGRQRNGNNEQRNGNNEQRNHEKDREYTQKEESRKAEREKDCRGRTIEEEVKYLQNKLLKIFHPDLITGHIETKFEEIVGRKANEQEKTLYKIYENKIRIKYEEITKKITLLKGEAENKIKSGTEPKKELEELRELFDKQDKLLNETLKEVEEKCNEIKLQEERRIKEEQERRIKEEQERRIKEEQEDVIEGIELDGYQENIETTDGGIFTGEIKNGELYKGKFTDKNGNEWYIDKTSEYPILKYQDKILLDKIGNKESINVGELKWTHRTNFDVLKKIIDSGIIGNDGSRGVQFRGGLGACYGEVAIIMKNSVMNLPPAPSNINNGHGNYDYFFSGHGAKNRDRSTFQKNASDFSFHRQARGENPNIDVPYLSIGGKNGGNGNFAHQVGIEHIEAVMLPAHAKKYPGYSELVKRINEKGIKVIEVQTEGNILDYAGGSIILAKDGKRGTFDEAIMQELRERYPDIPNFEQQVIKYLIETGRISEREIRGKNFEEIRENYLKMATENGFSRGGTRGGQYQNYSSQKNYTREQQAYYKYIIESRVTRESNNYPNPEIKIEEIDLDEAA